MTEIPKVPQSAITKVEPNAEMSVSSLSPFLEIDATGKTIFNKADAMELMTNPASPESKKNNAYTTGVEVLAKKFLTKNLSKEELRRMLSQFIDLDDSGEFSRMKGALLKLDSFEEIASVLSNKMMIRLGEQIDIESCSPARISGYIGYLANQLLRVEIKRKKAKRETKKKQKTFEANIRVINHVKALESNRDGVLEQLHLLFDTITERNEDSTDEMNLRTVTLALMKDNQYYIPYYLSKTLSIMAAEGHESAEKILRILLRNGLIEQNYRSKKPNIEEVEENIEGHGIRTLIESIEENPDEEDENWQL